MSSIQTNPSANLTFVRPAKFFLSGLSNVPHAKYYYVFLSLAYVVTVLGNSFLMCIMYLSRRLHTAKYIAVFHLALSDLCGSSTVIPKVIDTLLFDHQDVSYEACLTHMFFIYHFMNLQSLTLLVMAYDRLVAICFPLRYLAIVTKPSMFLIVGVMWIFSVIYFSVLVGLVNRISFCGSRVIDSYFCDQGIIYKLACNDNSINLMMGKISFGLLMCTPFMLIVISYFFIALALLKISHGVDRIKAMKTCTSHLMLVAIGYLPLISNQIAALTTSIDPNTRIFNNSLRQVIPSMLNPIIYTLKTEEVMESIKDLYKRRKINTAIKRI
ncbi:odorant receptor 109-6 [Danio rerio]|uniref:Odorant receptor n=1 Tax=Danio rerio TaxID=7955 RepID=Q2PRJ4_DANRE|nr:odorant receptor 109-6 [Danio rerio]XP_021329895.1 olfactory receptor-like protein DTMT [Danio rerio]ABC43269.1 odorant receptor [Danio rerio]ABC43273.1 odorant receptor [Danio rerio]|eukprot:NP_001121881.1 odorant receptor, family D, subfamily 109, member 6 [Danio rerio]